MFFFAAKTTLVLKVTAAHMFKCNLKCLLVLVIKWKFYFGMRNVNTVYSHKNVG